MSADYDACRVFVSMDGSVHLSRTYSWGESPACQERFALGSASQGLVGALTCADCQALLPKRWNVVTPDKRFTEDYRVVHPEVEDQAVAEQLASDLSEHAYVVEAEA